MPLHLPSSVRDCVRVRARVCARDGEGGEERVLISVVFPRDGLLTNRRENGGKENQSKAIPSGTRD